MTHVQKALRIIPVLAFLAPMALSAATATATTANASKGPNAKAATNNNGYRTLTAEQSKSPATKSPKAAPGRIVK